MAFLPPHSMVQTQQLHTGAPGVPLSERFSTKFYFSASVAGCPFPPLSVGTFSLLLLFEILANLVLLPFSFLSAFAPDALSIHFSFPSDSLADRSVLPGQSLLFSAFFFFFSPFFLLVNTRQLPLPLASLQFSDSPHGRPKSTEDRPYDPIFYRPLTPPIGSYVAVFFFLSSDLVQAWYSPAREVVFSVSFPDAVNPVPTHSGFRQAFLTAPPDESLPILFFCAFPTGVSVSSYLIFVLVLTWCLFPAVILPISSPIPPRAPPCGLAFLPLFVHRHEYSPSLSHFFPSFRHPRSLGNSDEIALNSNPRLYERFFLPQFLSIHHSKPRL